MRKRGSIRLLALSLSAMLLSGACPINAGADEQNGWYTIDGKDYWYENGVRQGYDPANPAYRGKEIYDPGSDAWYWLDNVSQGAKAVSKDVYQESDAGQWAEGADGKGKWVRYDANGHMVKGWDTVDGKNYYFDLTFGTMAKGVVTINDQVYYFNTVTGIGETGWLRIDGKDYWYENGIRQGYDPSNPAYRGKEIYDPGSDAWYWLDNVNQGAKAVSKDVYQESDAGPWAENADGTGKWVRYDADGHMVKGWNTQDGKKYYFDLTFGTMAKGLLTIDGNEYFFNPVTGVVEKEYGAVPQKGWKTIDGKSYYYLNSVRQGTKTGGEIYDDDKATQGYYYLDNSQQGARLENRDVKLGDKWVRYGADGKRLSGWNTRDGKTYYYDETTGERAAGIVNVNGVDYYFEETTGVLVGEYNGNNQGMIWAKTAEERYSASGIKNGAVTYTYTDSGKLRTRTEYNAANKVTLRETYTYDETSGELKKYQYTDALVPSNSYVYEYTYDETFGNLIAETHKNHSGTVTEVIKYTYKNRKISTAEILNSNEKVTGTIKYSYSGNTTTARYYASNGSEQYRIETETYSYGGSEYVKSKKKISADVNVGVMEGVKYEYSGANVIEEIVLGSKGVIVEDTKYEDYTFPTASLMKTYDVESVTYDKNNNKIRSTINHYSVITVD